MWTQIDCEYLKFHKASGRARAVGADAPREATGGVNWLIPGFPEILWEIRPLHGNVIARNFPGNMGLTKAVLVEKHILGAPT